MFDMQTLPTGLVLLGGVWIGGCYLAAPTLGERMLVNAGAVAACERDFKAGMARERADAIAALEPAPEAPQALPPQAGTAVLDLILVGRPGAEEFKDAYRKELEQLNGAVAAVGNILQAPEVAATRKAAAVVKDKAEQLRARFDLDIAAAGTVCGCRGRAAVMDNHQEVTWVIGTLGVLPAPDWETAMRTSTVVERCQKAGTS